MDVSYTTLSFCAESKINRPNRYIMLTNFCLQLIIWDFFRGWELSPTLYVQCCSKLGWQTLCISANWRIPQNHHISQMCLLTIWFDSLYLVSKCVLSGLECSKIHGCWGLQRSLRPATRFGGGTQDRNAGGEGKGGIGKAEMFWA